MSEHLWMTVEDVLRIVDANTTRQEIERALIANLPSNGGPSPAKAACPAPVEPTMICPRCKVDRFKEACPGPHSACPMKADAHVEPAPVAASPAVVSEPVARAVYLTLDEIDCLMTDLSDHDGRDFEPECPSCSAFRKLATVLPDSEPTKVRHAPNDVLADAPAGATHYQPHQRAYYKRVSATEWYVWSVYEDREQRRWLYSAGTSDSGEFVVFPVAEPPKGGA